MLVAAPGQTTSSYPAVLHNSSNVVIVGASQKTCPSNNISSPKILNRTLTSKKILNSLKSMPKTFKRSSSSINNNDINSKCKRSKPSDIDEEQNNENHLKDTTPLIDIEANSRENTSPNSRSSLADEYLQRTLSVRLNRDPDLDNSIPKVIISSKNSNSSYSISYNEKLSSSELKTFDDSNKSSTPNSNDIEFVNETAANVLLNTSPISVHSSSASSVSSSPSTESTASTPTPASPSPSPQFVRQKCRNYIMPPTQYHRSEQYRSDDRSNTNSISQDMCHFKPIRAVPITPFKYGTKSRGGASFYSDAYTLKYPKAIKATNPGVSLLNANCDVKTAGSKKSSCKKTGARIKIKKSKLVLPATKHKSAFVCMIQIHCQDVDSQGSSKRKRKAVERNQDDTPAKKKKKMPKTPPKASQKPKKTPAKMTDKRKNNAAPPARKKTLKPKVKAEKKAQIESKTTKKTNTKSTNKSKAAIRSQNQLPRESPPITRSRLKDNANKTLVKALPYYAKGRNF